MSGSTRLSVGVLVLLSWLTCDLGSRTLQGDDWARFRGPNGSGVGTGDTPLPATWSDNEHLKWKLDLPGPGNSCPIVVGNKVFVTCWSGYGTSQRSGGSQEDLARHLICVDRTTGKILWDRSVDPVLPEDNFRGMFAENGYATHTPVSDGERVYVFFGKTGVLAFDLEGNQLWQKSVGTGRDRRGWGSASSPILHKNLVIVTALIESESIVALDKKTGEEVWRESAKGYSGSWTTPVLVKVDDETTDLVLAVPDEVWGLNPDTGRLRWYATGVSSDSVCSSLVAHDGIVYALGEQTGSSAAIRAGGKGDVTATHVVWRSRDQGRICTPVYHDGQLYFVASKIATCVDATTGKRVYQKRLSGNSAGGSTAGGGRSFGGGRGGQDYSSPVVANGKVFYITRDGAAHVWKAGEDFELLGTNQFSDDSTDFSASPAVSDGALYIRSGKRLYCVGM